MVTFIVDSECPLYDLDRVQALIEDENNLLAWTQKCRNDVFKFFSGNYAEVADLIQRLKPRDYIDSEWCENGKGASRLVMHTPCNVLKRCQPLANAQRLSIF